MRPFLVRMLAAVTRLMAPLVAGFMDVCAISGAGERPDLSGRPPPQPGQKIGAADARLQEPEAEGDHQQAGGEFEPREQVFGQNVAGGKQGGKSQGKHAYGMSNRNRESKKQSVPEGCP